MNAQLLAILLFLLLPGLVLAQEETDDVLISTVATESDSGDSAFSFILVSTVPEFPGGEDSLNAWVEEQIRPLNQPSWTKEAKEKYFISLIVSPSGAVTDVKAIDAPADPFAQKLVDIFKTMPDWKPGTQRGVPIPVPMTYPIRVRHD